MTVSSIIERVLDNPNEWSREGIREELDTKHTIPQLKSGLKTLGLPTTGKKKKDLVDHLVDYLCNPESTDSTKTKTRAKKTTAGTATKATLASTSTKTRLKKTAAKETEPGTTAKEPTTKAKPTHNARVKATTNASTKPIARPKIEIDMEQALVTFTTIFTTVMIALEALHS